MLPLSERRQARERACPVSRNKRDLLDPLRFADRGHVLSLKILYDLLEGDFRIVEFDRRLA